MKEIEFDAEAELAAIKKERSLLKKRRYKRRKSELDDFRMQILKLYEAGSTATNIQHFLKKRGCEVHLSTVTRYLKSFKEYG